MADRNKSPERPRTGSPNVLVKKGRGGGGGNPPLLAGSSSSMSIPRKRISVMGVERNQRLGPYFSRRNNVPIPVPKIRFGAEVSMAKIAYKIDAVPVNTPKQKMTVYDYLDMSQVAQEHFTWARNKQNPQIEHARLGVPQINEFSALSTFRSQLSYGQSQDKREQSPLQVEFQEQGAGTGAGFTDTLNSLPNADSDGNGYGNEGISIEQKAITSVDEQQLGQGVLIGVGENGMLGGMQNIHNISHFSRPVSPSEMNDGFGPKDLMGNYSYQNYSVRQEGMTRWEHNQLILQENWDVVQKWEKQAREKGSLVGLSYVGRKLNHLHPSKQVRIPGVDDPEPIIPLPSLESLGLQKVATCAEYANLSRWQMGSSNPENKLAHLRVVQSIIVRESLILQVDKLLQNIEKHYYEYALLRMQSLDLGFPLNSEQLVAKKAKAVEYQVELRVAFANYRTATMTVFDDIIKWRNVCRRDVNMKDANVVMMWHGENYLLKMTWDVAFLYRYSVLRLWLEFEPNMFMLPPAQMASSNAHVENAMKSTHTLPSDANVGGAGQHQHPFISGSASVTSDVTADHNINDNFFGLPGQLPPLGTSSRGNTNGTGTGTGEGIKGGDEDLLSVISDETAVNYKNFYASKLAKFDEWQIRQKGFLGKKKQEFIKRRRVEEKEERNMEMDREMIETEVKRQKQRRINERYKLEESEKRLKNLEVLRIHKLREDAGEDPDKIKETRTKEEIELDVVEESTRKERDREERIICAQEADAKAQRDLAWREEKEQRANQLAAQEQSRFDLGIEKILINSEDLIGSSIPLNEGKEWQLLRNICLASWKCTDVHKKIVLENGTLDYSVYNDSKRSMIWEQSVTAAPHFWNNCEISPSVVETATGFKELWPQGSSIVPPLPDKLFRACSEFRRFLALEKKKMSKLQDDILAGKKLREKVVSAPSIVYFDSEGLMQDQDHPGIGASANSDASVSSGLAVRMDDDDVDGTETIRYRLRKRQESDMNLVDGTLRIYKEIAHLDPKKTGDLTTSLRSTRGDGKFQLLKFNTVTVTTSIPDLLSDINNNKTESMEKVDATAMGPDVFSMTRTEEEYTEGFSNGKSPSLLVGQKYVPPQVRDDASFVDNNVDLMYNRRLMNSLYESTQSTHPTGLEALCTKSMEFSVNSVKSQRTLLARDNSGVPIIRPEQQHRRPPDYNRPYWRNKLAKRIQALIRGFLSRQRLKLVKQNRKIKISILKIQSQFRRLIGVRKYQMKKEAFQADIEVLRKTILTRHKSALSITGFIRYCGAVNIGNVAVNPMIAYAHAASVSRKRANALKAKRAKEYSQNTSQSTTDGTSMTVRYSRSSRRGSPDNSPVPSRGNSRGGGSRGKSRDGSPKYSGASSSNGQAEKGEFGSGSHRDMQSQPQTQISSEETTKAKPLLDNLFKVAPRKGSRLIPLTVKPGSLASQPGTNKPRFRPFAARERDFMKDIHLPAPEKTIKHPNDCYRAPPALLTVKERDAMVKEMIEKAELEAEVGVDMINKKKLELMRSQVRMALQGKINV